MNLFFHYEFKDGSLLKDTSLTLNIDNVFDAEPPLFRGVFSGSIGGGYANGFTLGRLIQFGVRKKF